MPKTSWTPEERKAFGDKMRALRQNKGQETGVKVDEQAVTAEEVASNQAPNQPEEKVKSVTLTQAQFDELMNRLDKVETARTETVKPDTGFDQYGKPTGVIQRYSLDPSYYDDPRDNLYDLPELRRYGLRENYELDWDVNQLVYETKYGTSMADPKFSITVKRVMYDNAGQKTTKRVIIQTGVFFEDPASSIKEAVQLGLPIDKANTSEFMSQMRFLRYKQWLMDVFNPQLPQSTKASITNQVIDGKVYQIEDHSVII